MFIMRDIGFRRRLAEAEAAGDAEAEAKDDKPSCEVRLGNTLVLLHQAAVKEVDAKVIVGNTLVTDKGAFAGCGKHCIVLASANQFPVEHEDAVKYIKKYAAVMFGKDIANSIEDADVESVTEEGEFLTQEQIEQRAKNKAGHPEEAGGDEKGGGPSGAGDETDVDESVPSFIRFLQEAGDGTEGDAGGDDNSGDPAGDDDSGDPAGDDDEGDEAGDVVDPPKVHYLVYTIGALGQPEKDHTEHKEIKAALGGKLDIPDSGHAWGVKFSSTLGGGSGDEINLKKALKDFKGIVDPEELQSNVNNLFHGVFPDIGRPTVDIRDKNSLDTELSQTQKEGKFLPGYEYDAAAQAKVAGANYSIWIEVSDWKEKPHVGKKDIASILNAALKKMGGRYLRGMQTMSEADVLKKIKDKAIGAAKNIAKSKDKAIGAATTIAKSAAAVFRGGLTQDNVIFLRTASATTHGNKSKKDLLDDIPDRAAIMSCIYDQGDPRKGITKKTKGGTSPVVAVWNNIEKRFKNLRNKAQDAGDDTAEAAYKVWDDFKKSKFGKPDDLTLDDYEKFLEDYTRFYDRYVGKYLTEADKTCISLMREMFGDLYEAEDEQEEGEDDPSGGGGSSSGGGDEESEARKKAEEMATSIFIVPMPNLNRPGNNSGYDYD